MRTLGISGLTDLEDMLRSIKTEQALKREKKPGYNPDNFVLVHANGSRMHRIMCPDGLRNLWPSRACRI